MQILIEKVNGGYIVSTSVGMATETSVATKLNQVLKAVKEAFVEVETEAAE